MRINFTKMQGLGNDFVVINGIEQPLDLSKDQIRAIADRHFGVGCDQVLLVEAAQTSAADFRYRIYNKDGGEVEQCGNGARCLALFVKEQGLSDKSSITVETESGPLGLTIETSGKVTVDMGIPRFLPHEIPFLVDEALADKKLVSEEVADRYTISTTLGDFDFGVVSIGNPHAVMLVERIEDAPVAALGSEIERHERFPQRTNVGFAQVVDRSLILLRVFERGVGETLACGSGACAAAVLARHWGLIDDKVEVHLTGGKLEICWPGAQNPVFMTGPAEKVFEGSINI
jgi:diaminopimelate epimerase